MSTPKLDLYYFPECPFCQRVLVKIQELNVKVELKHIYQNPAYLNKLMQDTGRKTVPCLYIDDRPMFESAEIVKWLESNAKQLAKEV